MNLQFRAEPVRFESLVGENALKAVVEASLSLPAGYPPIRRLIRVAAVPRLSQWHAGDDEVSLEGTLDVNVLYAAEDGAGTWSEEEPADVGEDPDFYEEGLRESLHRVLWRREMPFHGVVELAGAQEGTEVLARLEVDEIRAAVAREGTSLEVDAVLAADVRCVRAEEVVVPAFVGAVEEAEARLQRETVTVQTHWARSIQVVSVQGRLRLPAAALPMERPLDIGITAHVDRVAVGPGWAETTGNLDVHLAYVPATPDGGPVEFAAWTGQLPVSHRFEDSRLVEGRGGSVRARVLSVDAQAADEGREVELFADVELTLEVGETLHLELVTGVQSPSPDVAVETRTEAFNLRTVVGRGEQVRNVSGVVELPADAAVIERLLAHEARAVVDEVLVLGDRVSVAGHVDVSLLYVGRDEDVDDPVYFAEWKAAIPVEAEIPVPGAHPPMQAHVTLEVEEIDPDLLNRETVEFKGRVRGVAVVEQERQVEAVLEAVAIGPEEEDPPSYTFLVVQPGDTLWKLARRYRMTPEAVLAANPHLEGETAPLEAGEKICIPRHRRQALVPVTAHARRNGA